MDGKKLFNPAEISTEAKESLDLMAPVSAHIHAMTHQDWQRQRLEDLLECAICGSELMFTHVTHFINQETEEEAHCPSCRIRVRQQRHRLQ
jgi:DNA-directed RNA polymerase subunit RPC12/RpoP